MAEDSDIEKAVASLARGLVANNPARAREAYRFLYRTGADCIPFIRSLLREIDWKNFNLRYHARYVSGFVALIHDIDEEASASTVSEFRSAGCERAISHALEIITRPSKHDYQHFDTNGTVLRIHREIPSNEEVARLFFRWLDKIPSGDLDGIEQVVVTRDGPHDIRGDYAPSLCSVRVIWREPPFSFPGMRWLSRHLVERTLYHEVGHHVHRHTFGQDPEQESEANQYASRVFRAAHPILNRIIGTPLRTIRRLSGRTPTAA